MRSPSDPQPPSPTYAEDDDHDAEQEAPWVPAEGFRAGFVTLSGQPNVGKSTLMNALVGEKLAIVSPKPQTTRDQIRGILTDDESQIVFVDTPGVHRARDPLNRALVGTAMEALESVDLVVLVVDAPWVWRNVQKFERNAARHRPDPEAEAMAARARERAVQAANEDAGALDEDALVLDDEIATAEAEASGDGAEIAEPDGESDLEATGEGERLELDPRILPGDRAMIRRLAAGRRPWLVALNKIDVCKPSWLLPSMDAYGHAPGVGAVVPVSAVTGEGFDVLLDAIRGHLPEAPPCYAEDELTDRSARFLLSELVREQIFLTIHKEVPYGVAVEIEHLEESPDLVRVFAIVYVEKVSQRGILLGKGGERMKAMATGARLEMEKMVRRKVFLEVHVRVAADWSEKDLMLRRFGYGRR